MKPGSIASAPHAATLPMPWLAFGLVAAIALVLAGLVHLREQRELASERAAYRAEAEVRTQSVVFGVNDTFRQIYRGIRTIARLPGVRTIDRHGRRFEENSRLTVQEIYNTLASSVAMSEVYIVPLDMDPDRIDPVTNAPEAPIVTFDELIIGRTAEHQGPEKASPSAGVPEIEYYEYRLMQRQLAILAATYPSEDRLSKLGYPVVTGPEVITCDNSRYRPSAPDDRDRSGLIISVPFYGTDGKLRGMVSAVVLSHALRDLLPGGNYSLHHSAHDVLLASHAASQGEDARRHAVANEPDPGLIYSEVVALALPDAQGPWYVWAGEPNSAFSMRSGVRAARVAAWSSYGLIFVVALLAGGAIFAVRYRRHAAAVRETELEQRVGGRTAALAAAR